MFEKINKSYFALIFLSLLIFINCRKADNFNYLPQKLGELNLSKVVKNNKATAIINRMHGKKLDDSENLIAHYENNDSKNILYVSVYENSEKAKTNLKNMVLKMEKGSSVFSPLTQRKMGNNVHFETDGMGVKHYFYRTDNILIWWQVEPDNALETYNDLIEFDFSVLNNRGTKQ